MWTFLNSELLNTPRAFYNAIIWDIVCNKKKNTRRRCIFSRVLKPYKRFKKNSWHFFILLQEHRLYS